MNILEIKNLVKQFDGVHAIDGLSFDIPKGAIIGIIGPNGSGKTTLINVLSGMTPFNAGTLVVQGVTFQKMKPREMPHMMGR